MRTGKPMRRSRAILAAATLVLAASAAASPVGSAREAAGGGNAPPPEITAKDFARQQFDRSTTIDNRWLPIKPGTQLAYQGAARTGYGKKRISHSIVFTVTDLTKVIDGVRAVVIWERDFSAGRLEEAELAFFAQDNDGNVWHLGQYPEEYEGGKIVATPTWISGLERARAGIVMRAEPRPGTPSYSQGFAPAPDVHWVDRAEVYRLGERNCVPFACYKDVLVTREYEPDKPASSQLKYYGPGVGNIRVGWTGAKDEDREILVLVKVVQLSPAALAKVRTEALKLEKRAYQLSKDVYAHTPHSVTP